MNNKSLKTITIDLYSPYELHLPSRRVQTVENTLQEIHAHFKNKTDFGEYLDDLKSLTYHKGTGKYSCKFDIPEMWEHMRKLLKISTEMNDKPKLKVKNCLTKNFHL